MAPKRNQPGDPTTTVLGLSKMTSSLLDDLARRGFVSADDVRAPPSGEISAHPRADEVVVFHDLFTAGLRMPLDPVVVDIFRLFKVYLHQMTPTSVVRLNLYMWLAKTCRLAPSTEDFARAFRVHYQPKKISVESTGGAEISAVPQYGCYTFAFHKNLPSPVPASKNKWANDWSSYWFYHKVTLDSVTRTHPLVVDHISDLGDVPKASSNVRTEDEALLALLRKLSKTFSTRDLVEEFVACGCFPVKAGWSVSSWLAEDRWIEGIPVPDFATVFNLRSDREFSNMISLRKCNASCFCLQLLLPRRCRGGPCCHRDPGR